MKNKYFGLVVLAASLLISCDVEVPPETNETQEENLIIEGTPLEDVLYSETSDKEKAQQLEDEGVSYSTDGNTPTVKHGIDVNDIDIKIENINRSAGRNGLGSYEAEGIVAAFDKKTQEVLRLNFKLDAQSATCFWLKDDCTVIEILDFRYIYKSDKLTAIDDGINDVIYDIAAAKKTEIDAFYKAAQNIRSEQIIMD